MGSSAINDNRRHISRYTLGIYNQHGKLSPKCSFIIPYPEMKHVTAAFLF